MKFDVYLQGLNAQEAFRPEDMKVLRDALLLPSVERGLKAVMQLTMARVNTLPNMLPTSQEVVVQLAHMQGQIAGVFEFLQNLTALTEEKKDDDQQ